jgi:hypothetical protein
MHCAAADAAARPAAAALSAAMQGSNAPKETLKGNYDSRGKRFKERVRVVRARVAERKQSARAWSPAVALTCNWIH